VRIRMFDDGLESCLLVPMPSCASKNRHTCALAFFCNIYVHIFMFIVCYITC
jgi:hypothetical protein